MLAFSDATNIVVVLAAFFVLLAAIGLLRVALRREGPKWRRLRVGVFIERDRDED